MWFYQLHAVRNGIMHADNAGGDRQRLKSYRNACKAIYSCTGGTVVGGYGADGHFTPELLTADLRCALDALSGGMSIALKPDIANAINKWEKGVRPLSAVQQPAAFGGNQMAAAFAGRDLSRVVTTTPEALSDDVMTEAIDKAVEAMGRDAVFVDEIRAQLDERFLEGFDRTYGSGASDPNGALSNLCQRTRRYAFCQAVAIKNGARLDGGSRLATHVFNDARRVREGVVLFEDVDESRFANSGPKERKAEFKGLRKSYPAVFAAAPGCIRAVER